MTSCFFFTADVVAGERAAAGSILVGLRSRKWE